MSDADERGWLDPHGRAWLDAELLHVRDGRVPDLPTERLVLLGQACLEADADLHPRGRELLLAAAARGVPHGAWLASYALLEGLGGPVDLDGGLALLTQAADGGLADAAFELGQLLARAGQEAEASPWLQRAAEQNHPGALRMMGRLAASVGDAEVSEALLQAAANAGSAPALFDRFLLLAQFGPTERLIALLDDTLKRREIPAGLLAELARLVAARDPGAMLTLAISVTSQGRAGRQAFVDGLRRGNPSIFDELGADLRAALELG